MSSAVVVVFICDTAETDALQKVRRCRYRKDFKFGLHGWVAVRMACVELEKDQITVNGEGRSERIFLNSILHPKKRRKRTQLFRKLFG